MIVVCKKDDIGLYHSFRKGVEYKSRGDEFGDSYLQILDDKGEYYYFNNKRFNEYFYDKKELKLRSVNNK